MGAEELEREIEEHIKEPFDRKVAGTMAALAAVLAIVSVLGHMANTEEIVQQQKASDQWAFYQAKSIRRYESEIARDVLAAAKAPKADEYEKNFKRYEKETDEIQKQAKEFEAESHVKGQQSLRYEYAEVFLEVAIVLASIAILTKLPAIWFVSIAGGLMGLITAATALVIK